MVYLDRHRIQLLLSLGALPEAERATHTEEADLFLRVALDGAMQEARTALLEVVGEEDGWPWSAVLPRELDLSSYSEALASITYAPPALVLLLGVDTVDPDALQPANWINDDVVETIKPRLQRWSPDVLRSAIGVDGWNAVAVGDSPADPNAEPETDEGELPDETEPAEDDGAMETPVNDTPDVPPSVPWYRHPAFLISAGLGGAALVGFVYAVRRR